MQTNKTIQTWGRRLSFRGLSLQQRLPLLIFILLLSVIVIFSWLSWYGVKNTATHAGEERLTAITNQLTVMFGQSAQTMITASQATAREEAVQQFLLSGGKEMQAEATAALRKLGSEKTAVMQVLLDTNRRSVLRVVRDSLRATDPFDSILLAGLDKEKVGRIHPINDSMYYAVVVPVLHDKRPLGYLVKWRLQYSTPQAIQMFSQLLGTDASLYVANADGSVWSDLVRPVKAPPVNLQSSGGFSRYKNIQGKRVIASNGKVPNTSWAVLVEFSEKKILEPAFSFLRWVIPAGAALILIGLVITWIMSRNITRPLKKLTAASVAIAGGNYSLPVEVNRVDELGKLARSFNAMASQVLRSQQDLEQKVQERTLQLETLNKELEAFSYSISHDLRAPLRIIDGYADFLQTDYKDKLDAEGNRVIDIVKENAQRMGQLIDDLLDFAQIGRKELLQHYPNMNNMVQSAIDALLPDNRNGINIKVENLETVQCDSSLLRQVWTNLIGNAIKYSSKNPHPEIRISSVKKDKEIVYAIKDNGVGFDMKYAYKLFGVFQRLHKATEYEGTGIGLALAKRILARHGGEIWAEAKSGEGATFYFSLPLHNTERQN